MRHLRRREIFLRTYDGLSDAFNELFKIRAMRRVITIGAAILTRRCGVRVRGGDENAIGANLCALRRQRLGAVEVIAANQAVVHDHHRQPRLTIITNHRPRV